MVGQVGRARRASEPWPPAYRRVIAARLLLSAYFFIPYIVLYARELHIALGLLLVIESVFAVLVVCFDLPAGHLADRIGARQALMVGTALEGTAALALGLIPHAAVFWGVQPLFAASQALTMGADAALAAAVLRRAGRMDRFEGGENLVQSATLAVTAVALVASSGLSLLGLRYTFIATGCAQFAALALLIGMRADGVIGEDASRIPLATRARGLAAGIRRSPKLRTDLAGIVVLGTAFSALLYLMPVYIVDSGTDEHAVGLVSAGVALAAAVATSRLTEAWPLRLFLGLAVVAAASLSVEALVITLAAAVLVSAAQARLLPRARSRVLGDLQAHGEATALSIVTTSRNLGFALLAPFLGGLTALIGVTGLAFVCAGLLLVGGAVLSGRMTGEPHSAAGPLARTPEASAP